MNEGNKHTPIQAVSVTVIDLGNGIGKLLSSPG